MSLKSDKDREKHIENCNRRAPFSCLATGLGSNRRGEETRQESILRHSKEAVEEIMFDIECAEIEGHMPSSEEKESSPSKICEGFKLKLRDVLEARLPLIIEKNMAQLREKRATSMLDEPTLGYTEDEDIKMFLKNLGIEIDNNVDLVYAKRVFAEALFRLHSLLMNEEKPANRNLSPLLNPAAVKKINDWHEVEEGTKHSEKAKNEKDFIEKDLAKNFKKDDILRLFKMAAGEGPNQKGLAKQACALLRIAYAIDYMERDPQISLLDEAMETLMDKMKSHIISKRVDGKQIWKYNLGAGNLIHMGLEKVEVRTKNRDRIISKLLHKPGNRTVKVLDHIGLRVTTKNAIDTLKLIYYMFFNVSTQMFPYMSIRIDETKNLILDANMIEEIIDDDERAQCLVDALSKETIDHAELKDVLADEGAVDNSNSFSLPKYRSIHIVVDMPINSKKLGRISFPIEIQILDVGSMVVNEQSAPHAEYTHRQTQAVLDRIVNSNNIETLLTNGNGGSKKK